MEPAEKKEIGFESLGPFNRREDVRLTQAVGSYEKTEAGHFCSLQPIKYFQFEKRLGESFISATFSEQSTHRLASLFYSLENFKG